MNVLEMKTFALVLVYARQFGVFVVDASGLSVSVMEGDSVALHTGVKTNQQEKIRWYFSNTRIAQITGDLSRICTDVQCNEGTERFRNRLKLDKQTGSLTITNTRTTDSGDYKLLIIGSNSNSEMIISVDVYDAPAAERDEIKRKSVKEGESVTLDPGERKNTNDVMTWYFNEIPIAEITGDQSEICTDDQCKERFTDRLKVNPQTGSLTITNTRTTDSGLYKLLINNIIYSIHRHRSISIISGNSFSVNDQIVCSVVAAGIFVALVLVIAGLRVQMSKRCHGVNKKGIPCPSEDHV